MAIVIAAIALVPVARVGWNNPPAELGSDAVQYFRMTRNLLRHGVFTRAPEQRGNFAPQAYREPAFPVFLAAALLPHRALVNLPDSALVAPVDGDDDVVVPISPEGQRVMLLLHRWRLVLLPIMVLLTGLLARALGAGIAASLVAMLAIGLSETVRVQGEILYSENLSMPLLIGVALCFRRSLAGSTRWLVATGGTTAALVLTKAAYFYLIPCLAAVWIVAALHRRMPTGRIVVASSLLIGSTFAGLAPWLMRNWVHFGRVFIAERGGLLLTYRAEYNDMNLVEYASAFLYLIPAPAAHSLLARLVPQHKYARLDRENPHGFYQTARDLRTQEIFRRGAPAADRYMMAEAWRRIWQRPVRHLAATLPLGWGGMFVEQGIWRLHDRTVPNIPLLLNPLLFLALAWLGGRAIAAREWGVIAVLTPFVWSLAFHSLATNNIPRFNEPLLPILWSSAAFAGALLISATVRVGTARMRRREPNLLAPDT